VEGMKKILYIFPRFTTGGAERLVLQYTQSLSKKKYDIAVASVVETGELLTQFDEQRIELFVGSRKTDRGRIGVAIKFKKFVRSFEPDIVHTHLFGGDLYGYLIKRFWKPSVEWIVTLHNVEHNTSWIRKRVWRYILQYADQVIAVAPRVERFAEQYFGLDSQIDCLSSNDHIHSSLPKISEDQTVGSMKNERGRSAVHLQRSVQTVLSTKQTPLVSRYFASQPKISNEQTVGSIRKGLGRSSVQPQRGLQSGNSQLITLLNGIDLKQWLLVSQKKQVGTVQIATIGRLEEQKGHRFLFDALAKLIEYDWELHVFGEGSLLKDLKKRAKRGRFDSHVHWHGAVQDLPKQLETIDVVVQPSLWEGMSLVIMEAMTAGKLVVASDTAGEGLIIDGKTGLLVPTGTTNALADVLEHVLNDKERFEDIGKNAREFAKDTFGIKKHIVELEEVYK
jgi:glycosyltransferase involved in cell wall biosynthesis